MTVGDVGVLDRLAKSDRSADRAAQDIERRLVRKRKKITGVQNVAATRPSYFSVRGLHTPGKLVLGGVIERLISKKLTKTGRHAFFVTSVCEDCGVLVAPKREGATLCMAIHETTNAANGIEVPVACFSTPVVPLLVSSAPVNVKLFPNANGDDLAGVCKRIGLARVVINSVSVFSLHAMTNDAVGAKPVALDLSAIEFLRIQKEAARLLGLRLLSDWALS